MVWGAGDEIHKALHSRDDQEFSFILATILQAALDPRDRVEGRYGGHAFGLAANAKAFRVPVSMLRRYLRAAAQAGMIKCVSWYNRGTKERFPLEVVVNPELAKAYATTTLGSARVLGQAFGALWLSRLDEISPKQGFSSGTTVPWGRWSAGAGSMQGVEAVLGEEPIVPRAPEEDDDGDPMAARIRAAADGGRKTVDALKRDQANKQRIREAFFVQGCAAVWQIFQTRSGAGQEPPAWSALKLGDLPIEQRRQRETLVKVFRLYGGTKAAVAWEKFCGTAPQLDAKGKLVFDLKLSYAQWSASDKKPSDFGKHINQLMASVHAERWLDDPVQLQKLRDHYGESFDAPASSTIYNPNNQKDPTHAHPQAARA